MNKKIDYFTEFSDATQSILNFSHSSADKSISSKDEKVKNLVLLLYSLITDGFDSHSSDPEEEIMDEFIRGRKLIEEEVEFLEERLKGRSAKEHLFSLFLLIIHQHKMKELLTELKDMKKVQKMYKDGHFPTSGNLLLILELLGSVDSLKLELKSDIVKKFENFCKIKIQNKRSKNLGMATEMKYSSNGELNTHLIDSKLDLDISKIKTISRGSSFELSDEEDGKAPKLVLNPETNYLNPSANILVKNDVRTSEKKEFNNLQLSGLSDEMDSKSCRSTDNSKPSSTLFKDKFVKIITKYSYPSEPETVSNNKEVCAECGIDMKGISNIFFRKYCYYDHKWYCRDCSNGEKMQIPWKVINSMDVRRYQVSKKAAELLKELYEQPIIEIKPDNLLLRKHKKLFEFLYLKRQMHLLFDTICNSEFVLQLMTENKHFLLKQNYVSLKNLVDLQKPKLYENLGKHYQFFLTHVKSCEKCQLRGVYCKGCNFSKVFYFDIKNTAICKKCRSIYHQNCFMVKGCVNCINRMQ